MLAALMVDEVTVAMVLVVREFAYVFPNNLLGLPPDRDIEFGIEVLLGTALISKTQYQMVLIELKTQLQELLDKGFIKPIISP